MKTVSLVPNDYTQRLRQVVDQSWQIFQSRFIGCRHPVVKESPFQHHFAAILSTVGSLYCTSREDVFFVDLETKVENIKGKNKYIDITCSFDNANVSCAIELKFKTERQGAQDHGRIDAYLDIEALELATDSRFTFGRFYMITDSKTYLHTSTRGVGSVFCLHDGFQVTQNTPIACSHSKGRENVVVSLRNPYVFTWEQSKEWYFLAVDVQLRAKMCT